MDVIIIGMIFLSIEYCLLAFVANRLLDKRFHQAFIYSIFIGSQVVRRVIVEVIDIEALSSIFLTIIVLVLIFILCYHQNIKKKAALLIIYCTITLCFEIVAVVTVSLVFGETPSLENITHRYAAYSLHKLFLTMSALLFLKIRYSDLYISRWLKYMPIPLGIFAILSWIYGTNFDNNEAFGRMLVFAMLGFLTCVFMVGFLQHKEEKRLLDKQLRTAQETTWFKKQWIEEREIIIRQRDMLAHDSYHHIEYLSTLTTIEDVHEYTARLLRLNRFSNLITGNYDIDCILFPKQKKAQEKGITFSVIGILPLQMRWVDPIDIVTIIGNGLENAIEACERVNASEKRINITFRYDEHLDIRIDNTFVIAPVAKQTGFFQSIKNEPGHGLGMESIQDAVDRYSGYMETVVDEGIFSLRITLQQIRPQAA
ncbi:MAG: GHKL domain-containing protein [Defluviitaleaceae bacterium]|nr:GHKL domain-containing protein [Defluviitaleaceae bacterium]